MHDNRKLGCTPWLLGPLLSYSACAEIERKDSIPSLTSEILYIYCIKLLTLHKIILVPDGGKCCNVQHDRNKKGMQSFMFKKIQLFRICAKMKFKMLSFQRFCKMQINLTNIEQATRLDLDINFVHCNE